MARGTNLVGTEKERFLQDLLEAGASMEDIENAIGEDRLVTLPLEFVLTGNRRYTLTEIARKAVIDPQYMRSLALALGYPNPRPRQRIFTEKDAEMAILHRRFLDAGLPKKELLEVARVLRQSMACTAAAVRQLVGTALIRPGDTEHTLGFRYAQAAKELTPLMAPILEHQLRLHLREQATREVITHVELQSGTLAGTRDIGVCFADLSNFTRLGEQLTPDQLGNIAARMATFAAEIAQPPVQLVKTIGDGAMFVSPDISALVFSVVELRDKVEAEGKEFPALRAGISYGQAVSQGGDWFGSAVNRASRIVDTAKPRNIVIDEFAQPHVGTHFGWSRHKRKSLRSINGRTRLYYLQGLS